MNENYSEERDVDSCKYTTLLQWYTRKAELIRCNNHWDNYKTKCLECDVTASRKIGHDAGVINLSNKGLGKTRTTDHGPQA